MRERGCGLATLLETPEREDLATRAEVLGGQLADVRHALASPLGSGFAIPEQAKKRQSRADVGRTLGGHRADSSRQPLPTPAVSRRLNANENRGLEIF